MRIGEAIAAEAVAGRGGTPPTVAQKRQWAEFQRKGAEAARARSSRASTPFGGGQKFVKRLAALMAGRARKRRPRK